MDVNRGALNDLGPSDPRLNRRRLIGQLAAAGFSAPVIGSILAHGTSASQATPAPAGTPDPEDILAAIDKDPRLIFQGTTNFETPLELVEGLITPNDLFFVRSNGPISIDIDPEAWRLQVSGLVDQPQELSLADLQALPVRTLTAFLECSGNSRDRFSDDPEIVSGTKWGNGAIGNVEWTGVSLIEVLTRAGIKTGAVDVVSQGGDFDEMQRGLPIEMAYDPDVMLVWEMNGEPLPAPNGGPVRLLVPGWGGIASTKWIVGLEVIDHPFTGSFNTERYVVIDENERVLRPVQQMPAKSVITNPVPDSTLDAGPRTLSGYAWSGYAGIASVEVSTDGGANWAEATITDEAGPRSWVRFEYAWDATSGSATLASRATDERGLQQPTVSDWNAKGYQQNAIYEVPVTIS